MTSFQAFVLGMIQGLGEFLPISSSAHLILVPWFFKWKDPGLAFDVFLHMGTLIAVALYFARDWWNLLRAGIASVIERKIGFDRDRQLFWLIIFGTIPAGLSGLLFNHYIEETFRAPLLIAIPLAGLGFLLYWVDGKYPALRSIQELTMKDALWIGFAQAFAVIPGVSRAGSTITMGRLLGLNREAAARFSFLLSFPIIAAAGLLKCKELTESTGMALDSTEMVTGFVTAAVFGLLSIHIVLRFVRHASYVVFAWYRVLVAGFVVFWSLMFKV